MSPAVASRWSVSVSWPQTKQPRGGLLGGVLPARDADGPMCIADHWTLTFPFEGLFFSSLRSVRRGCSQQSVEAGCGQEPAEAAFGGKLGALAAPAAFAARRYCFLEQALQTRWSGPRQVEDVVAPQAMHGCPEGGSFGPF